jgi:hypothetical protein
LYPIDSIANADYRWLCIHNLLGERIPMTRTPVDSGARPVTASDGSKGVVIDLQPENEAVVRWRCGNFNEDDLRFAIEWRRSASASNFEEMKKALPKPPIRLRTAEQVAGVVDVMLTDPDTNGVMLLWLLRRLRCGPETVARITVRWKWDILRSLPVFAPYAYHCFRVRLIGLLGMMQGIVGTRPSNIVDLEYLYYTPFAFIFCSGDKLHQQLAPAVLREDQSFVDRQDLQQALTELVAARQGTPDAGPSDDCLIRSLWLKHWKLPPQRLGGNPMSEEERREMMAELKPIIDSLREQEQEGQSRPRFPV